MAATVCEQRFASTLHLNAYTVAAPNIEPRQLLHQQISLCLMMFLHGSMCLYLQFLVHSPHLLDPSEPRR
jgi:hypothetical protein